MASNWRGAFSRRKQKAASDRGKRMAKARWAKEASRRTRLAELTADQYPSKIVRRIIVIENERDVKEATIWSFDSARSSSRKVRSLGL